MKLWVPAILLTYLMVAPAIAQSDHIFDINGRIPLGIESFRLQPANHEFYLMASAENPRFQGLYRVVDHAGHPELFAADHKIVKFYPTRILFRLTASAREKLVDDAPYDFRSQLNIDTLLTRLRFRLKVFHALDYRYIKPSFVQDVGVPRDIPYDERIYSIGFDVGKIPIEDRIVMEVLTPNGERVCKFHLDLL